VIFAPNRESPGTERRSPRLRAKLSREGVAKPTAHGFSTDLWTARRQPVSGGEAQAGSDDTPKAAPDLNDQKLVALLKDADLIFTAKTEKVKPEGQTRSIPPSIFGQVTFQDVTMLRGAMPDAPRFRYSFREGQTRNLDLTPNSMVLVATKADAAVAIVAATEANLTLAKKALAVAEKK
jgi:hypothetical protein